jgi:hypothetical protein
LIFGKSIWHKKFSKYQQCSVRRIQARSATKMNCL